MKKPWTRKLIRTWFEWRQFFLVVFIVMAFRSALADWYYVPTGSMKPSILEGDRIFVNKLAYDLKVPFIHTQLREIAFLVGLLWLYCRTTGINFIFHEKVGFLRNFRKNLLKVFHYPIRDKIFIACEYMPKCQSPPAGGRNKKFMANTFTQIYIQ